ncbi:hypothetical protein HLB23_01420 [Nocardia uniformis]|uniref:Acyl-CoA dehydrogenase/oxidase C-terminal domain-containing protein n=2 Tax=Nocardia uniformis TaxID=53432 RepID=A0A849BPB5_9NOCA|nr:hypothetical protein [Nocardia uniformis]
MGDILCTGSAEPVGTAIDLAILAEEAGAALYRGPLVSTAVGGPLLTVAGSGAVDGALLGAGITGLTGHRGGDGVRVNGTAEPVWELDGAESIVGELSIDGERTVVVLNRDTPGVTATELDGLDPSRSLGRVEFVDAVPDVVITGATALAALRRRGDLVVAAELLGVAQRTFDQTLDYVAGRIQFGRTVGSFQAIKHRVADLLTQVELTRSAVYGAAWQLTTAPESPRTDTDLAIAGAMAADTATAVTRAAVQLHGGIAITWEHWAHRYLRRAHSVVALTGGAPRYRRRLAELVDLEDGHRD